MTTRVTVTVPHESHHDAEAVIEYLDHNGNVTGDGSYYRLKVGEPREFHIHNNARVVVREVPKLADNIVPGTAVSGT